jgi:putative endonuclease
VTRELVRETWFVYVARCGDGSLYCGIARDVAARLAAHAAGKGARYTRGRGPIVLFAQRRCRSKNAALRVEHAVKQLARADKERLADPARFAAVARRALRVTRASRTTCSTPRGGSAP